MAVKALWDMIWSVMPAGTARAPTHDALTPGPPGDESPASQRAARSSADHSNLLITKVLLP